MLRPDGTNAALGAPGDVARRRSKPTQRWARGQSGRRSYPAPQCRKIAGPRAPTRAPAVAGSRTTLETRTAPGEVERDLKNRRGRRAVARCRPPTFIVYAGRRPISNPTPGFNATFGTPRAIHVLQRGSENARPKQEVGPGTVARDPRVAVAIQSSTRSGRVGHDVPRWRNGSSDRNPLTWRSIVNRVWHYHFGRGIVDTPNDFGRMGASRRIPSCSTGWPPISATAGDRSSGCTA